MQVHTKNIFPIEKKLTWRIFMFLKLKTEWRLNLFPRWFHFDLLVKIHGVCAHVTVMNIIASSLHCLDCSGGGCGGSALLNIKYIRAIYNNTRSPNFWCIKICKKETHKHYCTMMVIMWMVVVAAMKRQWSVNMLRHMCYWQVGIQLGR